MFGIEKLTTKVLLAGVVGLTFAVMLGLGYWHYTSLLEDRANLKVAEQELKAQKEVTRQALAAVDEWKEFNAEVLLRLDQVNANAREARNEANKVLRTLAEHDIGKLAKERPGLVENRINAGSADAAERLRCASTAGGCPDPGKAPGHDGPPGSGPDSDVPSTMESIRGWWSDLLRRNP